MRIQLPAGRGQPDLLHLVGSLTLRPGAVLLLLSSACGPQRAPAETLSPFPGIDPAALQAPPIYSLLGFRDRLELTSEQIERLDSIGQSLRPARGEPPALVGSAGRVRFGRGAPQPSPDLVAAMDSLAEVHRAAIAGVEQALTDRQRELVCELGRGESAAVGRAGAAPSGQGRRLYRTSGTADPGGPSFHYTWPWCSPPEGADPSESASP